MLLVGRGGERLARALRHESYATAERYRATLLGFRLRYSLPNTRTAS